MTEKRMLKQLATKKNCVDIKCSECPIKKMCHSTDDTPSHDDTGAMLDKTRVDLATIKLNEYIFDEEVKELLETDDE